jgi:hypothetical protein
MRKKSAYLHNQTLKQTKLKQLTPMRKKSAYLHNHQTLKLTKLKQLT